MNASQTLYTHTCCPRFDPKERRPPGLTAGLPAEATLTVQLRASLPQELRRPNYQSGLTQICTMIRRNQIGHPAGRIRQGNTGRRAAHPGGQTDRIHKIYQPENYQRPARPGQGYEG